MFKLKKGEPHMADDVHKILGRPTCSVSELQKILRTSKNPTYDAVKRGELPSIRVGGRILIPTAPLRKMLGLEVEAS
jgi:excisionase family DNA binding protein